MPNKLYVRAEVNDVIQLDPEHSYGWGPLLCIVEEVKTSLVMCYALHAVERGKPPDRMYLRIPHEGYVIIGKAEWAAAPDGGGSDE